MTTVLALLAGTVVGMSLSTLLRAMREGLRAPSDDRRFRQFGRPAVLGLRSPTAAQIEEMKAARRDYAASSAGRSQRTSGPRWAFPLRWSRQ